MGRGSAGRRGDCAIVSFGPEADTFISVDIETDGPIPGPYSMLALGAVVVAQPDRRFYREFRPISDRFVPEALAVSGLDRDRLIREGSDPAITILQFSEWAYACGPNPVFCSFASFDWMFVLHYFTVFNVPSPFGHTAVDMKSFYLGAFGGLWRDTKMSAIRASRPELTLPPAAHTHYALDDAVEQAAFLAKLLAVDLD